MLWRAFRAAAETPDPLFLLGWIFYILNFIAISLDMLLYFRNVRLDRQRDAAEP